MHRLSLFLLVFSLPFQLGLHFWPSSSFLIGLPLDYLSPIIYLTDIFLLFYIFTSLPLLQKVFKNKNIRYLTFALLLLFLFNTIFSLSSFTSFWAWFKLFSYYLFFLSLTQEKKLLQLLRLPLLLSTSIVILLQFLQLFQQSSLQGVFYFLGERHFSLTTPFIAKINLFSTQLIRPYSTFSHPNSLAGYLLLIFALSQVYFPSLYFLIPLFLAIIFTFSKMSIFTLFISFLPSLLFPFLIILPLIFSFYPFLISLLPSSFLSTSFFLSLPLTISQRLTLSRPIIDIFKQNFLTGTGLRSYLFSRPQTLSPSSLLPANLQPIHSLTTLSLLEIGLPSLFVLSFLFLYLFKKTSFLNRISSLKKSSPSKLKLSPSSKKLFLFILLIVSLTGSVDHYWWTLPQNQLILALLLAIIFNHDLNKKTHH